MCGLFGIVNYNYNLPPDIMCRLCNMLARESEIRGRDAAGIAFVTGSKLHIVKEGKPAYRLKFDIPENTVSVIGHTRHTTQGSEKYNYNNHPFEGKLRFSRFALAHNGVLFNDHVLKKQLHLPHTNIQTDSYVAVQLIEREHKLSFKSLRNIAEKLEGNFVFTILDTKNNLYIVKGENPISLLHFKDKGFFVYASTYDILLSALKRTFLSSNTKKRLSESFLNDAEVIEIKDGEILRITSRGLISKGSFKIAGCHTFSNRWDDINTSIYDDMSKSEFMHNTHLEELMDISSYLGYTPAKIMELYENGMNCFEIEEMLYAPYQHI